MSAWRKKALDMLHEYRQQIETSETPTALWIELQFHFSSEYRKLDNDLIRRFYQYARWCYESPRRGDYLSDAGSAAHVGFYEHLANEKLIREDVYRWLTKEEFLKLEGAFRYSLEPKDYEEFKEIYLEKRAKFVKQITKAER